MLLFHNISDNSEMDNSDIEDPDAYGYSVLAVPETIAVPYKLRYGKNPTINVGFMVTSPQSVS
ncbi:hypothetical protein DSO57_1013976 [Entomophthora muscae]|uniref:Uncharacterized protein n=1 Tax=Entomophthora muscae TaxID=34485 RepID=A0ACC2RWR3_9FUNG|nr:hypothetical protein DSO57_1013976 [Entomophthora muscae]